MIYPVRNIAYKNINFSKIKKKEIKPYNVQKQVSLPNISFRGYFPNFVNFEDTLNKNYFKLPVITQKDGSSLQIQPDKSQIECAKKLYRGDSVLYCAPTGTGKTAVAHYIISKNLSENKKTIYTTPLKALANDKLREFRKIYGENNVGLLTGDIKINTSAPIQIMTTEIYNNQTSGIKENPTDIQTIIFDEAHYLGDEDRGNVWESAIVNTPFDKIQVLLLSATIGNSDEVSEWIQSLSDVRDVSIVEVPSENRFVPLIYYIHQADYSKDSLAQGKFLPIKAGAVKLGDYKELTERQQRALEILYKETQALEEYEKVDEKGKVETFEELKDQFSNAEYNLEEFKEQLREAYPEIEKDKIYEIAELLALSNSRDVNRIHVKPYDNNNYPALINDLRRNNMLPALIFKLSKNASSRVCKELLDADVDLTTEEEKEQIEEIIEKYKENDIYLGANSNKKMLLRGYAYHHAGELPQYRKLVEELFSKKLLKVVSATSTLSAGINMPAKTVVITGTNYKKYSPLLGALESVDLTPNDFHQMTGRAGRRGIDSIGNVVFYNLQTPVYGFKEYKAKSVDEMEAKKSKFKEFEDAKPDELQTAYNLLSSSADNLRSQFKPDWQALANYYQYNSNDEKLKESVKHYFKYYLSKNKDKEEKSMMNKFERYKTVLLKQGFIEQNNRKEISLTPKGKILTMSQGINPLMLSSLIYSEFFKELEPEEMCQVLGYIAGSENKPEEENLSSLVEDYMEGILQYEADNEEIIKRFNSIKNKYSSLEGSLIKAQKESRIPLENIMQSESFSGFASFIWAYLNEKDPDSINNFRKISEINKLNLKNYSNENQISAVDELVIKSCEGNTYKILSQVVSILNQIIRICDFALSNPKDYQNVSYCEELKNKAEVAIILTKQNPIWDAEAL